MTDYIMLPRSVLNSEVIHNPYLAQLLLYLLSKADDNGATEFIPSEIQKEFGWSESLTEILITNLQCEIGADPTGAVWIKHDLPIIIRTDIQTSPDTLSTFADTFNAKVKGTAIPQIRDLSDTRKKAIKNRAKEHGGIEALEAILDRVVASDFLSGRKTDFCASFDWIFKKANFIKILEGNYDNKPTSTSRHTTVNRQTDRYSALETAARSVIQRPAACDYSPDDSRR